MSIKKITNEELLILENTGTVTEDYYFLTDLNVLTRRVSNYQCQRVGNIIFVLNEYTRQYNVARERGKYYYVISENNIWYFNLASRWEYIDGDDYPEYLDEDPE